MSSGLAIVLVGYGKLASSQGNLYPGMCKLPTQYLHTPQHDELGKLRLLEIAKSQVHAPGRPCNNVCSTSSGLVVTDSATRTGSRTREWSYACGEVVCLGGEGDVSPARFDRIVGRAVRPSGPHNRKIKPFDARRIVMECNHRIVRLRGCLGRLDNLKGAH